MDTRNGKVIRIGGGGGFADDRLDAAVDLIQRGELDYLSFDSLSENELSQVTMRKLEDPSIPGYDRCLELRMKEILPAALEKGVKIIGNMGSTNPVAAARYIAYQCRLLGYPHVKVAAITGDDVRQYVMDGPFRTVEGGKLCAQYGADLLAAHAYVPSYPVVEALRNGASIVLAGRIGDAAMYMTALMYEFGWAQDAWDQVAKGIMCGHMAECAGQLTGGYYADPPYKDVPYPFMLGFPIIEAHEGGKVFFTKAPGTGGAVTVDVCKEQALYEVHDPANYMHAEVVVDLSQADFIQRGPDRVEMVGIRGKPRPDTLKVALGVREGYFSTATVWFAGPGARSRGEWARQMLYARFEHLGYKPDALNIFLMGIDGVYGNAPGVPKDLDPWEVGVRVACRAGDRALVEAIMTETAARMSTNGPAAGTCEHATWFVRDVIAYDHLFIPRGAVQMKIAYMEG